MDGFRTLEIYRNGNWVGAHMQEVLKGELFRMFDPPSVTPVVDEKGYSVYKATSLPQPCGSNGNWMIDAEGVNFDEEV